MGSSVVKEGVMEFKQSYRKLGVENNKNSKVCGRSEKGNPVNTILRIVLLYTR